MTDHEYTGAKIDQQNDHGNVHPCLVSTIRIDPGKQKGIQLLENSRHGHVEGVRKLLTQGAPFMSDALGSSPMHWSVKNKHHAITALLLKGGIPRDVRNKVDRTPLHIAAELGDWHSVQLLLEYGAEVNTADILKMTPLHWAAQSGDIKTVRLLLDYGADFTALNKFDKLASDIAFKKQHFSVVNLIQEFKTIEKSIRVKRAEDLKQQVKPAVVFSSEPPNDQITHQEKIIDESIESLKRKYADLEEESRSGDEELLDKVSESALQQLKSHGINLLESLHDSTLKTAVERGQSLVLTDAGKLALSAFDKLFPGRNLPPLPSDIVDESMPVDNHSVVDCGAERKAKEEELRAKKYNLRRRISFHQSQAQILKNKLKVTERRIKTLQDELNSFEK